MVKLISLHLSDFIL